MVQTSYQCLNMCKKTCSAWCIYLVCYIILITTIKDTASASDLKPPAVDFSRHHIVRPIVQHTIEKREISSTLHSNGDHHSEITVSVVVDGEDYVLDLRLNEDLVPDNHVIRYQKDGETILHKPSRKEVNICQYWGTVRGRPDSWVAVSTCNGLRGVMYDGKKMRYIEPAQDAGLQSEHYVYENGDLQRHHSCGYKGGVTNNSHYDPQLYQEHERDKQNKRMNRYKRSTEDTQVRGPYNANRMSRYVELVLVADNREYRANGEDINVVYQQMKDVANIINSVYAPLNIFICLVGVVVWTDQDEIVIEENGDNTLSNFLHYRKQKLLLDIPNDNAQLLTRQAFNDGVVGKALKGPICTYEFSGGVSTNHSQVLGLVATTIAHEMGHNFGMEHDTAEDCTCPDDKCIMSPSSTSVTPVHWSSCSLSSLAFAFERGMDYCLRNKPTRLFSSPTCGNGFVEPGEQCDCGIHRVLSVRNACDACCDPDRCMLRSNATCATGACCDLKTCRPFSPGTVCRPASQECDLPEYCTGHSEYCPDDVHKMDATSCDKNKAYCVHGFCRSHEDQCRLLWGATGHRSHDNCYTNVNLKGNNLGNCGLDRVHQTFKPCTVENALCGMLHCKHLNEQLEFGMESVAKLSYTYINNNGSIEACRAAMIDLGLSQVDPGLVPDGAKCGKDKMCLNQECVKVSSVLEIIRNKPSSICPSNCSGNGVCNSEGQCHCDNGYAPPYCHLPGFGGSLSSGPAIDPSVQKNFMIAMYVIFLGIIPSILIIFLLFYYSKHNMLICWKKPKKSLQSPKKNSLQRRLSRGASKFAANFHSSQHSPTVAPPVNVHTVSSPDDMSSSLLRSDSDNSATGNCNPSVNFFGNFKGFSLTPIDNQAPANTTPKESNSNNLVTNGKPKSDQLRNEKEIAKNKRAKITPVHRSSSNSQSIINQSVLKPVLRTAPPLPIVPVVTTQSTPKSSPTIKRTNSSVQNKIKSLISSEKLEMNPPVVPNPAPRPVISSPILEASTCTAKELISPLQGFKTLGPIRSAPIVPSMSPDIPKRPISMHGNVLEKPLPEEPKKVKEGLSLNRIASFLKQEKPKEKERHPVERSHSMPKNPNHQVKVPKTMDKVALRNLQISNPILQKDIELSVNTVPVVSDSEDGDDSKTCVARAQSMRRAPVTQKPIIQSFGSMRQPPGVSRPVSVVGRPTAPPPPLPNLPTNTMYYENPSKFDLKSTDYVDCIEEKQAPLAHIDEESGDNIYAVIEETPEKIFKPLPNASGPIKTIPQAPPEGYNAPKNIASTSGSTESVGLLGEIVNEIQNRNFDSIYSTSTLARKKKEREKDNKSQQKRDSTYMNADYYKSPESLYSNSGAKSSTASTTSSGYLVPSAVNVPKHLNKKAEEDTLKDKTSDKSPPSPTLKGANTKIPTFTRQITPPGLRNTTTFRNVPSSPKNTQKFIISKSITPNSPDVVSSCAGAEAKNVKAPDVINNNKLNSEVPKLATKPSITSKPDNKPPIKLTSINVDKKIPSTSINITPKPTNVTVNTKISHKTAPIAKISSKVDSNVKAIADSINKNKPKVIPKPSSISVPRTDSSVSKPIVTKLTSRPSNVANLQQKFENRKSIVRQSSMKE